MFISVNFFIQIQTTPRNKKKIWKSNGDDDRSLFLQSSYKIMAVGVKHFI